ncbi:MULTISPECIES: DUF167 domain-containing protein [Halobacteriovorax]|uniref:UPF0235 protein DAY19_08775 n=1 Tax=Halobacteriovorax vibrionivorans TaxID=2152716 RepID=A0ABY0IFQ9_9BACT|nr:MULTISPECIES: DUF167 domain-containing protein [Halobacteriovorax]RZF21773.1 DUF167 domain-containing protein [Halobacteriovorax vibrionivorans]TGD48392.1 DUF167 domain-containing protein [Halobacteriovorax sp. Y22]
MERSISISDYLTQLGIHHQVLRDAVDLIIEIDIWAKPGAKVEKLAIADTGHLIVSTQSPPEDGKANAGIMKLVAKKFGVSKGSIELTSGQQSKFKKMAITFVFAHNKDSNYFLEKIKKALA